MNTIGKRSNNQSIGVQPENKIERRPIVQDAFVGREHADSKSTRPSVAASLPWVRYDLERISLAVFSQYPPQVRAVFQQVDPAACVAFVVMERIQEILQACSLNLARPDRNDDSKAGVQYKAELQPASLRCKRHSSARRQSHARYDYV
jgi:hypothetical protein